MIYIKVLKNMNLDVENILASAVQLQYLPNPGNAGDAVIAAATWQLFDAIGVAPAVIKQDQIYRGNVVILGGGGNLVPTYNHIAGYLQTCLDANVARCVLLPHTIRGHESLLEQLDERFTLFARDAPSYVHANRYASGAQVVLAHDLVLGLDIAFLETKIRKLSHRFACMAKGRRRRKLRRWRHATSAIKPDKFGRMALMRTDIERTSECLGEFSMDLSAQYNSQYKRREECERIAGEFIAVLRQAREIHSNRLHVGIVSAMLGKTTVLYDNSYGKNSAVWRHSLKGAFNNLTFSEDTEKA